MDNKKQPQITGRKNLLKGNFLTVSETTTRELDGKQRHYWRFDKRVNTGAIIIPVTPEGKILLIEEYRIGAEKWVLSLPKGGSDYTQEPPLETAARELQEEIGMGAEALFELSGFYALPALTPMSATVVLALNCRQNDQGTTDEEGEWIGQIKSYSLTELRQTLHSGAINDAESIAALNYFLDGVRLIDDKALKNLNAAFIGGAINQMTQKGWTNPFEGKDEENYWTLGEKHIEGLSALMRKNHRELIEKLGLDLPEPLLDKYQRLIK